jgi:hypothetical protein
MNSLTKCSQWLVLATLLCFAPGAFAQGRTNPLLASQVRNVTSYAFTSTFIIDPIDKGEDKHHKWCESDRGKKCAAVPEGGSALMYLLLASLTCFGAMVLRSRRQSAR